jgi:hypothetical protein
MDRKELLAEAIKRWGIESQSFMAIEEMAELTKALSKIYRECGQKQIENVIEEIADVKIMLEQMEMIYEPIAEKSDIKKLVAEARESKLYRLAQRLGVKYVPNLVC